MDNHNAPIHVVIAGGGVAALETMLALRALAGDRVRVTLLAPGREFRYRPMAVAEPFTIREAQRLDLAPLVADADAELVAGALGAVEAAHHRVITLDGSSIPYDALVIACGARAVPAFAGSLTIGDSSLGAAMRGLVRDVEDGYTREIAFVAPAQAFWPLPLYELALMTARQAFGMNMDVEISIVSPEAAPLGLFGSAIAGELAKLLREAGIAFLGSTFAELVGGQLRLEPSGARLRPQRIVALPLLEGPQISGVVTDPHGFIPVDGFGQVFGQADVYAAGDVTSYPIKQGGIAAQEADVVAAVLAARAGLALDPQPLRPVMRGMLLTGGRPRYLEAELLESGGFASHVTDACPWDPPTKIAAPHLGRYLSGGNRDPVHA
jgi:sulfide:quinone oxidoreductase